MRAGIAQYKRSRGRPAGSNKEQVAIRLDRNLVDFLRSTGKGWHTRVNDVLLEWAKRNGM